MATAPTIAADSWPASFRPTSSAVLSRSPPLDFYRVIWNAAMILAILLVNKAGVPGAVAFFAVMVIMALKSPRAAFQALALIGLGLMMNTFFVPKTMPWTFGRLALPLFILVRFGIDASRLRTSPFSRQYYVVFLIYVFVMAVCSIASGWFTQIALLKLFFFWSFVTAVLLGTAVLRERKIDLTEWFVSLIAAATFIGIMAMAMGQSRNMTRGNRTLDLFNGALLHPNCHSLYGAMFVLFLATLLVMGAYKKRWLTVPLIGIWLMFMALSASRSSILATVIGSALLFLVTNQRARRLGARLKVNIPRSMQVALVLGAVLGLVAYNAASGGRVWKAVVEFVNKEEIDELEQDVEFEGEEIIGSRKKLMELAWSNFLENPVFGIGFGVAKTSKFVEKATLFTASAEKGFLVTAALEEGGILGSTTLLCFIVALFVDLRRQKNLPGIVALGTFLGSNIGEATFLSAGGMGSFGWVMVGAAMILGDHCWQPQSLPVGSVAYRQ